MVQITFSVLCLIIDRDIPKIVAGTIALGSKWIIPNNIEFIIIACLIVYLDLTNLYTNPRKIISSQTGATMQAKKKTSTRLLFSISIIVFE